MQQDSHDQPTATVANRDTQAARHFHEVTKYREVIAEDGSVQVLSGIPPNLGPAMGEQDTALMPYAYKVYVDLPAIALPPLTDLPDAPLSALAALRASGDDGDQTPDLNSIARICLLSNGILKRGSHRPDTPVIEYRAAGGTGARYHLELYLAVSGVAELPDGLYHYAAHDHSLRQLREGDVRGALVAATGQEPAIADAPVVLAMSSVFWRNAWRYQDRAYRHAWWDGGTTLANVLALAAAQAIPARLVLGFVDTAVNALLGIDGEREATLALVALGRNGSVAPALDAAALPTLDDAVQPYSTREIAFPATPVMHRASSLTSADEVVAWRAAEMAEDAAAPVGDAIPLAPLAAADEPDLTLDALISRRRSTRYYDTEVQIPFDTFSTLLALSAGPLASDCVATDARTFDTYVIANGVADLPQGSYRLRRADDGALVLDAVRTGDQRAAAQHLAVHQGYAGDAHVNWYALARLDPLLAAYGNRGYRVAQLTAALHAGRTHLATHALGLGAVGSTSFDDVVTEHLAPGGEADYVFVTVFGKRRRSTPAPAGSAAQ